MPPAALTGRLDLEATRNERGELPDETLKGVQALPDDFAPVKLPDTMKANNSGSR